jgi:hypothetical protein
MSENHDQIISEHYQKTFELTYKVWEERNTLFVYLVIVTGFGLLLILRIPEMNALLIDTIIKLLDITDPVRITQLQNNFPFDILLSIILLINFYLTQRLYSTNLSVSRGYQYLGLIEQEIKESLSLAEDKVLFTREGKFYWNKRSIIQQISKICYMIILIIILVPFMILKIQQDFAIHQLLITFIDIVVIVLTLIFLFGYIKSTINLDNPLSSPGTSQTTDSSSDSDK